MKLDEVILDPKQQLLSLYEDDLKEFEKVREFALKEDGVKFEELEKLENNLLLPEEIREICYLNYIINTLRYEYNVKVRNPNFLEYSYDRIGNATNVSVDYGALTTYLAKKYSVLSYKDTIFAYVNNRYMEAEYFLLSEIERLCEEYDQHKILTKKKIATIKNEVISRLKDKTRVFSYPFKTYDDMVFLKNGALYLEHKILLPLGAFWFNSYVINANYNSEAKSERVENFLKSLVPQDKQQFLTLIPACCLLGRTDKVFMLVGDGANGKSTYLNFLRAFLGSENCASVSLQDLAYDRFKSAELQGKIANIYADLSEKPLRDSGKFKLLSGKDTLTVERKFHHPYQVKNTAVMIFSANKLPEVSDDTYAFWRRFYIVEFPYRFSDNPELSKWAENPPEEDKSAFLNMVLEAITRIELVGIPSEDAEKLREIWKRNNDSVYAFVLDKIEKATNNWVPKDTVYNRYVEYCEENDLRILPKNLFAQKLAQYVEIKQERKRIAGDRVMGWVGIRFKEEKEEKEENPQLDDYVFELKGG
ncbi:MAG: phage/plasmid primase, P4 family [Archaeoglobales archaeon]|nr:phage/plasmid primase, P4 family [Archaeoglobales archaeon]